MGKDLNKFRGCLIGGAAGDALGYAVEFMSAEEIFIRYGEKGITEFQLKDGRALISDDTQMTLFTANGLLYGSTMQQTGGPFETYTKAISLAYRDWLITQESASSAGGISWLNNVPEMNSRRAPGNTCLSALSSGIYGTIASPINDSKGCGGIMRVAPIGLYLQSLGFSLYDTDMIAAEAAAITHGHPLGYMPAAALAQIIGYAVNMPDQPLLYSVMSAKHALSRLFPEEAHLGTMVSLIDKAIELSLMDMDDLDAIRQLGEGWVGEECLAIAIYCALKYSDNFSEALVASVNHDGDSDSTGAVTGNILGAYLGIDAIPANYIDNLELKDIILEIADDLYNDCPISYDDVMEDKVWVSKYMNHDYVPGKPVVTDAQESIETESEDEIKEAAQLEDFQIEMDLGMFAEPEKHEPEPVGEIITEPAPEKKIPKKKAVTKKEIGPESTPMVLHKVERRAKPEQVKPASSGTIKFFKWTDLSFGGYDLLAVCNKDAYLSLCLSFQGCNMDAYCEGGKYCFLIDSEWEEITPLRREEFLHPQDGSNPVGEGIKYKFNPAAYSYRVYTDKELK